MLDSKIVKLDISHTMPLNKKMPLLLMATFLLSNTMLFSSDAVPQDSSDALRFPKVDASVPMLLDRAVHDSDGYLQVATYAAMQVPFLDDVFQVRTAPVEVLDIAAGNGSCLERMLADPRAQTFPFRYTAVEPQAVHAKTMRDIWQDRRYKLPGSYGGIAEKNFHDYYGTNLAGKTGKFDLMFAGFALHIMQPVLYWGAVKKIYTMLKPGGRLYLTQHSYSGPSYSEDYISAVESGSLMPFWSNFPGAGFSSDPDSMTSLMVAAGFTVNSCGIHEQIHISDRTKTKYLAMIVEKPLEAQQDEESLALYDCAADRAETTLRRSIAIGR